MTSGSNDGSKPSEPPRKKMAMSDSYNKASWSQWLNLPSSTGHSGSALEQPSSGNADDAHLRERCPPFHSTGVTFNAVPQYSGSHILEGMTDKNLTASSASFEKGLHHKPDRETRMGDTSSIPIFTRRKHTSSSDGNSDILQAGGGTNNEFIRVQQLLSRSPELRYRNIFIRYSQPMKFPAMDNLPFAIPRLPSPLLCKPMIDAQMSNHWKNYDTKGSWGNIPPFIVDAKRGNPTSATPWPFPTANLAPWSSPPPGNDWLAPLNSPTEGLIYKPYTGLSPPNIGISVPGSVGPINGSPIGLTSDRSSSLNPKPGQIYFQPRAIALPNIGISVPGSVGPINGSPIGLTSDRSSSLNPKPSQSYFQPRAIALPNIGISVAGSVGPINGSPIGLTSDRSSSLNPRPSQSYFQPQAIALPNNHGPNFSAFFSGPSRDDDCPVVTLSLFPTTPSVEVTAEQRNEEKPQVAVDVPLPLPLFPTTPPLLQFLEELPEKM